MHEWKLVETAPDLDRVMVCGWEKPTKTRAGYWWYHEDVVSDGTAIEHSDATHWCEIVIPAFPAISVSA